MIYQSSPAGLKAINRIIQHEGGYVNHPADPGGETNYGITQAFAIRHGYNNSIARLTQKEAERLYARALWVPYGLESIPFVLAYQWMDFAVNSGPRRATLELQPLLNVKVDGGFGPITQAACVAAKSPRDIASAFLDKRLDFLKSLPTWPIFNRGWRARINQNRTYLLED